MTSALISHAPRSTESLQAVGATAVEAVRRALREADGEVQGVTAPTAVRERSEVAAMLRRPAVSFVLAFVAATVAASVALVSVVTLIEGGSAPGWSHWLCSPATLRSAVHAMRGSGVPTTLLTALEVHWPHFLPILAGLGTLVYLWRANALYYTK